MLASSVRALVSNGASCHRRKRPMCWQPQSRTPQNRAPTVVHGAGASERPQQKQKPLLQKREIARQTSRRRRRRLHLPLQLPNQPNPTDLRRRRQNRSPPPPRSLPQYDRHAKRARVRLQARQPRPRRCAVSKLHGPLSNQTELPPKYRCSAKCRLQTRRQNLRRWQHGTQGSSRSSCGQLRAPHSLRLRYLSQRPRSALHLEQRQPPPQKTLR